MNPIIEKITDDLILDFDKSSEIKLKYIDIETKEDPIQCKVHHEQEKCENDIYCGWNRDKGLCKLVLTYKSKFIIKLLEELVRNNTKRKEILNNEIRFLEISHSFYIYPNELLFTEHELENQKYLEVYKINYKQYLKKVKFFNTEISQYKTSIPKINLPVSMLDNIVGSSNIFLSSYQGFYKFILNGDEYFTPPQNISKNMVKILDFYEYQNIKYAVAKINTELDTFPITNISENIHFKTIST